MKAIAKFLGREMFRRGAFVAAVGLGCASQLHAAPPSFVYETTNEFLAAGDFNGDGILDVLVLDKTTGNSRVGFADTNAVLTWSAPLVTGVSGATGCAVGRFLLTSRDAVAVTAPTLNRVNLVDLSNTNTAGTPVVATPDGLGPHTLVPLADPLGGVAPAYNDLLVASSDNNNSAELLDLLGISAGVATETGQFGETGPFDRGNALQLSVTPPTFAAGIVRGTNDLFVAWQFTNAPGAMLLYSNLASGSDYTFGIFNSETLPRFLFYQPGGSNLTVVSLTQSNAQFVLGGAIVVPVAEAIQGVFYVGAASGGSAMILFSDGVQGLTLPGGVPTLSAVYQTGTGAAGNVFTGVVPLGGGVFALLDGPPGGTSSVHAQTVRFNGTTFKQLSSGNLPTVTARNTRANVWLFEIEPFVNRQAGFVTSFNTPDWSDAVTVSPAVSVTVENDGGASSGLGTPGTNTLGTTPGGAAFGLPNQYNPAISIFSYTAPQAAEPVIVTIAPPAGTYDGPINISFSTLNSSDKVYYRVGAAGAWRLYAAAFPLTNDNSITFYGTNSSLAARSQLQVAAYSLGISGQPTPTVNLTNGVSSTNPPPAFVPATNVILSPLGTIFYGRRSITNTGTLWAINLDGSGDTFITAGVRPRASRDGHWLAYLQEGNPFGSQGNVWLRNLQTGSERRLFVNTNTVVGYDWEPDGSALIMDYDCGIGLLGTNGVFTRVVATDCYEQAPVLNPVDGRVAFQDLNPSPVADFQALFVAPPNLTNAQRIVTTVGGASWPAWSVDGQLISFTDGNTYNSLNNGTNLWVVTPDGLSLNRICDFTGTSNQFPHGAIWTPDSAALVGAGTVFGTNGLWVIPLNPDRTDCMGQALLLPTTPGDAIDFAGSIVVAKPSAGTPRLVVQTSTNNVAVNWSTNYPSYTLEYTLNLTPPVVWQAIPGPFPVVGFNFQYLESLAPPAPAKFFRLIQQ